MYIAKVGYILFLLENNNLVHFCISYYSLGGFLYLLFLLFGITITVPITKIYGEGKGKKGEE